MLINRAVITAAGSGSRMKSGSSKPMTRVGNKKLIQYGIDALLGYGINEIYIIYSKYSEDVLQLKEIYPNIHFIKQEIVNGSLSTFKFIPEICKPPFLQLDCDIIFLQTDFRKMLESIEEDEAYGYFAVVSKPTIDNEKYLKLRDNRIIDFDKKGFTDGYAGGMIYFWREFPQKAATEFYKGGKNSLAAFFNQLVKKEVINAMFIKQLLDVDTMEEVIKVEKSLKEFLE